MKKTGSASSGHGVVNAAYLRNATGGQLLGRLLEVHHALDEAVPPFPLDKSFVDEVIKKEYLCSENADVQAVLASILADVFRLGSASSPNTLPFAASHAHDVVQLYASVFARIRATKKPSSALLMHARHTIERLAASYAMQTLVSASASHAEDHVASLFETFLDGVTFAEDDSGFLSRVAMILASCISATHTVTESQLQLLLAALSTKRRSANPVAAAISAATLRRHEEMLSFVVAHHYLHLVESGVEELKRVEIADGEPSERRAALQQIVSALEGVVDLCRVGVALVSQLVPGLQKFLLDENADVRTLACRGFAKVFGVSLQFPGEFMPTYNCFLSRFQDPKPTIRLEVVKFAQTSLLAHPTEANWHTLADVLEAKLHDMDEGVRRSTITCICELAIVHPASMPKSLLEAVGMRTADKNPKVRQHACERLMQLYRGINYAWIPNAVFQAIRTEGGIAYIELGLHTMLPPATKVQEAGESERKKRRAKDDDVALFDFELEGPAAAVGAGGADANHPGGVGVSDEALRAAAKKATLVDGLARLCGDLNAEHWKYLLTIMHKKYLLRCTIRRLFEMRAEVKKIGSIETEEGQRLVNGVHRLLSFLQQNTHAKKEDEWDTFFRAKDEKVAKAFLAACDEDLIDQHTAGEELVKKLQGRVPINFVTESLVPRMFFPFSKAHADELVARIASERTATFAKRFGSLRAAVCVLAAAPQFTPLLLPALLDALMLEANREVAATGQQTAAPTPASPPRPTQKGSTQQQAATAAKHRQDAEVVLAQQSDLLLLLLQCIGGSDLSSANTKAPASSASVLPVLLQQHSKQLITVMGKLCLQSSVPAVGKAAATALCNLFPTHQKALAQLMQAIRDKINGVTVAGGSGDTLIIQITSWIKAATVILTRAPSTSAADLPAFAHDVANLMLLALRTSSPQDQYEARSKKVLPYGAITKFPSVSASIVDATAKCIVRLSMNVAGASGGARGAPTVAKTTDDLVHAFRETRQLGTDTVGACLKRLAIAKQLVKLFCAGTVALDLAQQLTTAVIVSAEHNPQAREVLQDKIAHHMQKHHSDVRTLALLVLTAVSEETKAGYNALRERVHAAAQKLRGRDPQQLVSLGEPDAVKSYPEYTIPTLVLFLAHHTFYTMERDSNFLGFQRVWHLLFDELFQHGTSCASFCAELLRKLKSRDDALDVDSTATRVMCDLASKVMIECLGQRSVRADTLKPYPGGVVVPMYFVQPKTQSRFPTDVVYLDSGITVSAHPPFKIPVMGGGGAVTPAKPSGGAHALSATGGATSARRENINEDEEGAAQDRPRAPAAVEFDDDTQRNAREQRGNERASPRTGSKGGGSSSKKKRGRDNDVASTDDENEGDEGASTADERTIRSALQDMCAHLSRPEFETLSWKVVKRRLETAIDKKLTPELTEFVHNTLRELAPPA